MGRLLGPLSRVTGDVKSHFTYSIGTLSLNEAGSCKSFFVRLPVESNTPVRGNRNGVCFSSFCSCASPKVAQPLAFIRLVQSKDQCDRN